MPSDTHKTALPPGYRILNDGPGREVLMREEWDECPVFDTVEAAADHAWMLHKECADGQ